MLGANSGALGIPRDLTVLYLSGTLFTLLLFFYLFIDQLGTFWQTVIVAKFSAKANS